MLHHIATTRGVRLLLLAVLATPAAAADDAEFAFNLLTDVAPILALFGDAFAKQFMSESLTWVDHLIFAMVPLGIITAIPAAIRVQGMQVAKAFVGRARENRALAEIELMSSTSGEVCELFNGNSIVRAMGKPKVEQYLIFPNEYDALEEKYKRSDDAGEELEDKSCGIHSLRTATSREPGESKLMVCKPYSSDSVTMIQECSESALAFSRRLWRYPLSTIKDLFRSASLTPPGDEKGAGTASTDSGHPPLPPQTEPALSGPPNLQLNLSSDHFDQNTLKKRHELILAAVAAVLLQTGLIVIAATIAYRLDPGSSSLFEIKVYGFPCYAAGSLLLSIGTGLCSFIVEHSTIEHSWEAVNLAGAKTDGKKAKPQQNAPRLVWIQRYQTVNDQSFKGYIILAGPKRRVITSRRDDDIKKHHLTDDSASGGSYSSSGGKNEGLWQWLTVGAALSAGLGFVAQFMGLRGLAFPCSIAQLGAIFIMALIRASIRRRLGKVPAHCPALEGRTGPDFETSSSQQLIRVRERLGDLCHFTSKSTESALSLSQPIELFMNNFSPRSKGGDKSEGPLSYVNWRIEATELTSTGVSERPDKVKIPVVRRSSDGKWEVDVAKIDAVLSLWMASNEAKTAKDAKDAQQRRGARRGLGKGRSATGLVQDSGDPSPDWRRIKVGDDSRRTFGRIIGDNLNDEVLKRDISWWVDSIIAEQSDPAVEDNNNSGDDSNNAEGHGRLWSRARSSDVDLVIGFNGNKPHNGPARELGIASNDCLHTILAQHLFTSFMWTVVEFLPKNCLNPGIDEIQQEVEIESPKEFNAYDSSFAQDWLRIKLRHRQLTKVVRKMESYGLGSTTDILLCMIPALSSRNLLPNQAILKLMPRVSSGRGWVETAICHEQLLETIKTDKVSEEDRLSVGIVVASMDFLSFAYEPYDEQMKSPRDLDDELEAIAQELLSPKFTTIMEKLAPVYRRQYRHSLLYSVLQYPTGPVLDLDKDFAKNILGFTWCHLAMFQISDSEDRIMRAESIMEPEKGAKARDLFGWTPYHYYCAFNDRFDLSIVARYSQGSRKRAIQASGIDGMTLLHLAARSGNLDCLEIVESMSTAEAKALLAKKDIWGRQALHIASKLGHEEIAAKLLEMGSRSDELDDAGRCPVDYFVQRWKAKGPESAVQEQHSNDSEANDSPSNEFPKNPSKESLDLFLKFVMEPHCRYSNGKSFLHFAVEVANDDNIRTLVREKGFDVEARDNDGRTPLHYAILSRRPSVANTLIKDLQAKPSAKDSRNTTALMFAVQENYIDVARALLDASGPSSVDEVDDDKKAAIHYVRGREMVDFLITNECNLLATDSDGRTALHTAIGRKGDVALYLLGLEDPHQVQTCPFDNEKESLLVTACKHGLSEIVPEILKRWPNIINTRGGGYGQPPVSWACVNGNSDVVEKLLQYEGSERVDVNKIDTGWWEYTPLHYAVKAEDSKSLALLLEQPSTKPHQKSRTGETPLRQAVWYGRKDAARMLLQDHRTTPEHRLRFLEELTPSSFSVFHCLIGGILGMFADTSLSLESFPWLVNYTADPDAQEPIKKFVADLKRGGWKKFRTPYHLAILLGDAEFVQILKEQDAPQGGLDEDNWSLVDYATRFDRDGTLISLVENLQPSDTKMQHKHREPTALIGTHSESIVKGTSCTTEGHDHCSKVHDVEVIGAWRGASRACMRSDHSIPPSKKYFYFEVEVLQDSACRWLGIGFCGLSKINDQLPGWFKGSWGYHGGDGALFIESGTEQTIPSSDFGDSGKFKSGDVVGVCLNVDTGQGFCTRNGKKLNMGKLPAQRCEILIHRANSTIGNAFEERDERFRYGKMYPCVGFNITEEGMGLYFSVNFNGSGNHPFKYKGPFEF
ncbi:hypothetical protein MRS44_014361 [Fusarium solani]|uniref:uncharacterized protein n=1 Tax=Fusarium solani TaxID=169388 RepID=UPI0032C4316F|nr:hypothetical protein MRS44_014361 [Fusarium solani]